MRPTIFLLPPALLATLAAALKPLHFRSFTLVHEALPNTVDNATEHDLLKRQYSNTCPDQYDSCANLGAPNLCCISNAVCSADQAGMVACCPYGAVCTGTITGYIQSGTVDSNGVLIGGAASTTENSAVVGAIPSTTSFDFYSSTSSNALIPATQPPTVGTDTGSATGNGFIIVGSSTVATPGAALRRAEVPGIISAIVYVLEILPL